MSKDRDDLPEDIRLVCVYLDPVAHRFGLRGPVVSDLNLEFQVAYFGSHLGLEVQISRRGWGGHYYPYMMVFRHEGDGIPAEYTTRSGRVVKRSLFEVAKLLGKSTQDHVRMGELAGQNERTPAVFETAQRIMEDLWPSIELEEARLFDSK